MAVFTFDDMVRVKTGAPTSLRPGARASVIMVFTSRERTGKYFEQFPIGTVYSVEFEDGASMDIHESFLEKG